jgi:hypothetical protein
MHPTFRPPSAGIAHAKPSPSPSCTTSALSDGTDVEGVSNPTGPSPQNIFRVSVPSTWKPTPFARLSKGVAMRSTDPSGTNASPHFANVAISTLRAGSLATSVTLAQEVDKERKSSTDQGYTVESKQTDCTVAGAPAVALNLTAPPSATGAHSLYEILFIGYVPDSSGFSPQDAITFTLVGGSDDAGKDKMIQNTQAVAASWQWENGATSTVKATPAP